MKHFTIDKENNITFHTSCRDAKGADGALFSTEKQLADAIGNDNKRLLEIWNSLAAVKPVTRFANRRAATERIWKAIQNLGGPVTIKARSIPDGDTLKLETLPTAPPPDDIATQTATALESPALPATSQPAPGRHKVETEPETQQGATPAEPRVVASVGGNVANVAPNVGNATKKASRAKKVPTADTRAKATGKPSKTDAILKMLTQPSGASLQALIKAPGWQAHSVRGFVSGTLGKKMGLTVVSSKAENGERRYSIAS